MGHSPCRCVAVAWLRSPAAPRLPSNPPSPWPGGVQGTACLGLSSPGSLKAGRAGCRSCASPRQTLRSPRLVPSSTARASPVPNPNRIRDGTDLIRSGISEESPNPTAEPRQAGCPGQREALGEVQSAVLGPELLLPAERGLPGAWAPSVFCGRACDEPVTSLIPGTELGQQREQCCGAPPLARPMAA